jgi:hypothetical protein
MALKRWTPGQPAVLSSATWNTFCDVAEDFQRSDLTGSGAKSGTKNSAILTIKNTSGVARDRFDVLKLDTPIITEAQNADAFKNLAGFNAVALDSSADATPVILLQPLDEDQCGRGVILGAAIANVEILDNDHKYAKYSSDHPEYLESSGSGSIKLLYNPGTGNDIAIVLLGSSSSSIVCAVLTEDLVYGGTADATEYTTVSPLGGTATTTTLADCWCPFLMAGKQLSSGFHIGVDKSQGNMVIQTLECSVDIPT